MVEEEEEEDEKPSEPACPWEVACTAAAFVTLRLPLRCCLCWFSNEEPLLLYIPQVTGEEELRPRTSTLPDRDEGLLPLLLQLSGTRPQFFSVPSLDVLRICLNLFHACPLEAGLTLMTGGRTAGGGSRGRLMAEGSARGHRVRASMQAPGAMASRSWACTRGPAGTATRAPGRRANGMASGWRARAAGSTEASGRRGSKVATGSWRAQPVAPATKGRGATGCRMDTAPRPTRTEVRMSHSGPLQGLRAEPLAYFEPSVARLQSRLHK